MDQQFTLRVVGKSQNPLREYGQTLRWHTKPSHATRPKRNVSMAQSKVNLERHTFVKGLITEANALTFPEDASSAEDNFILNRDGSRQRRLGMDYEAGHTKVDTNLLPAPMASVGVSSYEWLNVAGNADISIGVVQVGNRLWFVDLNTSAPSSSLLNGENPLVLQESSVDVAFLPQHTIQWTDMNGMLLGASQGLAWPILLEYDSETDTIQSSIIYIAVRDIWGIQETTGVDARPTNLTNAHHYNLLNQGWPSTKSVPGTSVRWNTSPRQNNILGTHLFLTQPHVKFKTDEGVYPSNADKWYVGKRDSDDEFDPTTLIKNSEGTTPAPRGKFVIDLLARGQSRMDTSGVTGLPQDTEEGRITSVASFSGRVFYSGVESKITDSDGNSPNYTGTLFYTQIVDSRDKLYRCYQEADPTSEFDPDLVASDGGSIPIPGASKILKLVPVESGLMVFASNGVWQVTGPEGVFSATEYTVKSVSVVGAVSANSIVRVDGSVFYWTRSGIYVITPEQVTGRMVAQNITVSTIQTLYLNINIVGRENCKGTYDPVARKVRWLYNDGEDYDGVEFIDNYNRELILDLTLNAFSTHTLGSVDASCPYVAGYVVSPDYINTSYQFDVYDGNDPVEYNGDQVVYNQSVRSRGETQLRYLTLIPDITPDEDSEQSATTNYFWTLSSYADPTFYDWRSYDSVGVDAAAYMETGQDLQGDTQRTKQAPNLSVHCRRTETGFVYDAYQNIVLENPSSCLVTAKWDFSDSSFSNKEGTQFQAYRLRRAYFPSNVGDSFNYGQSVITTNNPLRGSGTALQLRFDTEPGKDLHLYGWGMLLTGTTEV